ncbi:hypothetical protein NDU88_006265 [Pleurodeles waltl]|uniref:Uncharacterized protein n=1 Tax=Pleurodeles waltl TaxID=8319 RepID=A0AAV7UKG7_PLEWA|nr:hypothetical protein NDU88_006265 [Pleurodeles waltl]
MSYVPLRLLPRWGVASEPRWQAQFIPGLAAQITARGADDRRPPCIPLSGTSGTSATPTVTVREAGSPVGAVTPRVGLPAAASLVKTGGPDPAGGVSRGHAWPVEAAVFRWASAVAVVLTASAGAVSRHGHLEQTPFGTVPF